MNEIQMILTIFIAILAMYIAMFKVDWLIVYIRIWGWIYKKKHSDVWKK